MKKLTIGIITWNACDKLKVCLDSIYKKVAGLDFEVIVVDNGSEDGTVEMIKTSFPQTVLIENAENRGVAPSRNQFLSIADSEYVPILDADTEIITDKMNELVAWMDANPDVAIAGSKLIAPDGSLQYTCRSLPQPKHVFMRRLGSRCESNPELLRHELRNADHDAIIDCQFVIGAFQLVRGAFVKKAGLLDGRMFYGFEDADYCARALADGFRIAYYPALVVMHHEGRITSGAKKSLKHLLQNFKSYGLFYIKNRRIINSTNKSSR